MGKWIPVGHGRQIWVDDNRKPRYKFEDKESQDRFCTSFIGRQKPSVDKEVKALRPRAYEDTLLQAKAVDDAGKMTPELREIFESKIADLKIKKEAGLQEDVDYYYDGHPLEKDPEEVEIINE